MIPTLLLDSLRKQKRGPTMPGFERVRACFLRPPPRVCWMADVGWLMEDAVGSEGIAANIATVRQRMADACKRAGRAPEDVTLIAVTKTQPAEHVAEAYAAGVRHFGENYVQEALGKRQDTQLNWPDAIWHFIGHLQSNKARDVVGRFDLIESVDTVSLAREIARRAQKQEQTAPVLLEVKLDPIPTKFGFAPGQVLEAANVIRELPGLEVHGLMTMAPFGLDAEQVRPYFQQMRQCYAQLPLESQHVLSMGMTGDFETAIEEGATHVRIGTAIFGQRNTREEKKR